MVCNYESFRAQCQPHQVIVMQTSMYGRMRQSRCFVEDEDLSHCASSVMGLTDSLCSGKRQCQIAVPNPDFDNSMACLNSVKGYFEGSYKCMKGKNNSL